MNYFFYIAFFIFGTIIGSFLNVVVLRYNTGLSFVKGKSKCFSCGAEIEWYDLIPVLSYMFLGGKCRYCQSRISIQYPIVEFVMGLIFALSFWKIGFIGFNLLISLFLFSLLVAIAVYDFRHKIIPDGMVFLFAGISLFYLIYHAFVNNTFNLLFIWNILAGPILFLFFFLIWFISSGRAMGFGDAKLALGVGWFLGISSGISAIILAFWIGAFVSVFMIILQRLKITHGKLTIKSEIPFAPFIISALFVEFFLNFDFARLEVLFDISKNV